MKNRKGKEFVGRVEELRLTHCAAEASGCCTHGAEFSDCKTKQFFIRYIFCWLLCCLDDISVNHVPHLKTTLFIFYPTSQSFSLSFH
jgi:hypothetical protein